MCANMQTGTLLKKKVMFPDVGKLSGLTKRKYSIYQDHMYWTVWIVKCFRGNFDNNKILHYELTLEAITSHHTRHYFTPYMWSRDSRRMKAHLLTDAGGQTAIFKAYPYRVLYCLGLLYLYITYIFKLWRFISIIWCILSFCINLFT